MLLGWLRGLRDGVSLLVGEMRVLISMVGCSFSY